MNTTPIKIKPLAWTRFGPKVWNARHQRAAMWSIVREGGLYWLDLYPAPGKDRTSHSTLESAKEVAAFQWEIFIKSAIEENASL